MDEEKMLEQVRKEIAISQTKVYAIIEQEKKIQEQEKKIQEQEKSLEKYKRQLKKIKEASLDKFKEYTGDYGAELFEYSFFSELSKVE